METLIGYPRVHIPFNWKGVSHSCGQELWNNYNDYMTSIKQRHLN